MKTNYFKSGDSVWVKGDSNSARDYNCSMVGTFAKVVEVDHKSEPLPYLCKDDTGNTFHFRRTQIFHAKRSDGMSFAK